MNDHAVSRWLLREAKSELDKARAEHRETLRMVAEYSARNRGRDGWKPGIWYQENELRIAAIGERKDLRDLRVVVEELKHSVKVR